MHEAKESTSQQRIIFVANRAVILSRLIGQYALSLHFVHQPFPHPCLVISCTSLAVQYSHMLWSLINTQFEEVLHYCIHLQKDNVENAVS